LALRRVSVTGFRSEFFGANSLLSLRFFAVLLWTAAVLALIADRWTPGQGMAMLAAAIVAVIAINGIFSFWQEYRAEETMAALQRLLPHQVRALRNGKTVLLR
jgi:sodium/potassium-transporting ATPase subunit alpha